MADEASDSMDQDNTTTGDQGAGDSPSGAETPRTFSQADVDRIVQDRLARDRRDRPSDKEIEELRSAAQRLSEIEAENQTELEKATARAAELESELERRTKAANQRLVEAAVLAEATRQNAIKPEHLHRLIDTDAVTVGDDGQVTGVQDAVKAFLDANPEYVGARTPGPVDQGARPGGVNQLTRAELASMSPDEINKARKEGRLDRVLKGG